MDLSFNSIKTRAKNVWPKKSQKTPEIRKDILKENVETEAKDYRLSFRFSSVLDHIKKNWTDLKSLKNKF
jgi:hypothetical protein